MPDGMTTAIHDGAELRALWTRVTGNGHDDTIRLLLSIEARPESFALINAMESMRQQMSAAQRHGTPMLLWCPQCFERHIDEGEFTTRHHHTHACQKCGMVWRPAIEPTFGVRFLPGFENSATEPA